MGFIESLGHHRFESAFRINRIFRGNRCRRNGRTGVTSRHGLIVIGQRNDGPGPPLFHINPQNMPCIQYRSNQRHTGMNLFVQTFSHKYALLLIIGLNNRFTASVIIRKIILRANKYFVSRQSGNFYDMHIRHIPVVVESVLSLDRLQHLFRGFRLFLHHRFRFFLNGFRPPHRTIEHKYP